MENITMRRMILSLFLGSVLSMSCVSGEAVNASGTTPPAPSSTRSTHVEKARQAMEELRQGFTGKNLEHFFGAVSDQSYFNWQDFKIQTTRHFDEQSQVELKFTEDHVLEEGSKVDIRMHWQKRWVRSSDGQVQTQEGQANFTFLVDEAAHLIQIKGDSPF